MPDFTGTPGPDSWTGTGDNEIAHGDAGSDTLSGGGGNDTLYGEGDDDTLYGEDGNDTIWGGAGLDHLFGGAGDDIFWARMADLVAGEDYHGGSGNDALLISTSASAIDLTGIVLDSIELLQVGALLESGDPNLSVTLTSGQLNGLDNLYIGFGTLIISTAGTVDFSGGRMQLLDINLNAGGNTLNLTGVTVLNYSPPDGPYINGGAGADIVTGSDNADRIYGNDGNDVLSGGRFGSDLLDGGAGDDRLIYVSVPPNNPAGGTDAFYGGTGLDTLDASGATAAMTVILGINPGDTGTIGDGGQLHDVENIDGSAFNDTLTGSDGANVLDGKAGNDVINGRLGADTLLGGAGNDLFNFTAVMTTNQTLPLGHIDGGADYDTLDLRSVSPVTVGTVSGQLGMYVGSQSFTIAGIELILLGADANMVSLLTNEGPSLEVRAGDGNDNLSGGGAYLLYGEGGDDRFFISGTFGSGTSGIVDGGAGVDTLGTNIGFTVDLAAGTASSFAASYSLSGIENVELSTNGYTSTARGDAGANRLTVSTLLDDGSVGVVLEGRGGDDVLIGSAGNDMLDGGANHDILDGGAGADTMTGGAGNDTYYLDSLADVVVETAGNGTDRLVASISYTLAEGLDIETLEAGASAGSIQLIGSSLSQTLIGNGADNGLNGLGGVDIMIGGNGNDTYYVDNVADQTIEYAGEGTDIVYAGSRYELAAGSSIDILSPESLAGTAALTFIGNALVQLIYGNAGANTLTGGGGADRLVGFGGDDVYIITDGSEAVFEAAGGGNDIVYTKVSHALAGGQEIELLSTADNSATTAIDLTGNEFANTIYGNNGINYLRGGGGNGDKLIGLGGDDVYFIVTGDEQLFEAAGGGNDVVYTNVSHALVSGQEIEILAAISIAATNAIDLSGNEFVNTIYGNNGVNNLRGGGGADTMIGFGGNDVYYILSGTETVVEAASGGFDVVYTNLSYTLGAGQQIEILSSVSNSATTAMDLTGNELGNQILGNNGVNVLNGGGGSDVLQGFGGNDTYIVDNDDVVVEGTGGGFDTVAVRNYHVLAAHAEVELLTTIDQNGTAAITLWGNEFSQTVIGNAGANQLNGGGGADTLRGLGGQDVFVFNSELGADNVDTILDFVSVDDIFFLDHNIFAGLPTFGPIDGLRFSFSGVAADADDRIIYNQTTGELFFDPDGTGAHAQVLFAILTGAPMINSGDFQMI